MTRLLVVNPNTSRDMTHTIEASALTAGRAIGVEVETICPEQGPQSIEGRFDEIVSAYWTLDCVMQVIDRYDGVVVACYGPHPVIEGIREASSVPTMGIMEGSILYALPLGSRFSIVTTSPRWVPLLEEGLASLGVQSRCASVRSSGLAVLDLDRLPHAEVCARLAAEAVRAVEEDEAESGSARLRGHGWFARVGCDSRGCAGGRRGLGGRGDDRCAGARWRTDQQTQSLPAGGRAARAARPTGVGANLSA